MNPRFLTRRRFVAAAAALGVAAAWARGAAAPSRLRTRERRDLYPEGVASGDPDFSSVLLWTRRPFTSGTKATLRVEVAEDAQFERVVATTSATVLAAADWTCRVLVGNLKPSRVYWYRFIDQENNASRTGRTLTAPATTDSRPVRFAFVSCQDINMSALNAWRRMIFEDERAEAAEQIEFILHLGDFIYEAVWYPSENAPEVLGRRLRDILRYPRGEKITLTTALGSIHIPTTVEDYRTVYRAYLHDSDLQDARARWPFVCMWDNHEFSWLGWQSVQRFNGENRPAQTRKVAANQAWFEYQPARIVKSSGPALEAFDAPQVRDAPIIGFDAHGFGDESNNRIAVESLAAYRALRWGRHVELLLTDQHNYRSEDPDAGALGVEAFLDFIPQEHLERVDAGGSGKPPRTILGEKQKQWFLSRLKASPATWKIWGNPQGTLDQRADFQNLPADLIAPWPGSGYAIKGVAEPDTAYSERAEIYSTVRDHRITGFATVCGNRHQFWAGLAAPYLPPRLFEPVGIAFVTGALSSANHADFIGTEAPTGHALRPLFASDRTNPPGLSANLLFRHGVRSALEYSRSGDIRKARALSNPELAPHLSFLDLGGHGYATVRASANSFECEFVCIETPRERATTPDGGPLRYRVLHRALLWKADERPRLEQRILEGDPLLLL